VRSDLSRKPAWYALRDVVGGATAKLRPRLSLSTRMVQARVPAARARAATKRRAAKRRAAERRSAERPSEKRRSAKRRAAKRRVKRSRPPRLVNRITVSGRLTLPGTPWPNAVLALRLPRKGYPPRTVLVPVKEGIFWARFEGRDLTSGTVEVSYGGSSAYHAMTSQVQVVSSATTSR
jgi:hypothetical protein